MFISKANSQSPTIEFMTCNGTALFSRTFKKYQERLKQFFWNILNNDRTNELTLIHALDLRLALENLVDVSTRRDGWSASKRVKSVMITLYACSIIKSARWVTQVSSPLRSSNGHLTSLYCMHEMPEFIACIKSAIKCWCWLRAQLLDIIEVWVHYECTTQFLLSFFVA